jgi:hypothetical protein
VVLAVILPATLALIGVLALALRLDRDGESSRVVATWLASSPVPDADDGSVELLGPVDRVAAEPAVEPAAA